MLARHWRPNDFTVLDIKRGSAIYFSGKTRFGHAPRVAWHCCISQRFSEGVHLQGAILNIAWGALALELDSLVGLSARAKSLVIGGIAGHATRITGPSFEGLSIGLGDTKCNLGYIYLCHEQSPSA